MNKTSASEIAVVVVSWNDAAELSEAVASLAAARAAVPPGGPRVTLTVVVNGGAVRPEEVLARWPGASILVNEANRGFGPAANQGAALATASILLFLNPDTRAEGDPFSAIAQGFAAHPEAAALAPRLLDWPVPGRGAEGPAGRLAPPGREDQFTFQLRGLPTLRSDLRELFLWDHLFPNNPGRRRHRYADRDREAPREVEQAAAAAFAVRTETFRRVGGFDEEFVPAWFEDVDLCARLAPAGKILYWPAARFRHRGGVSSRHLGYARFLPIYYWNSLLYRRRHYGRTARVLYRALLIPGMLLRLVLLPFRREVPRPRIESARAYLGVLRVAAGLAAPARLEARGSAPSHA